MFQKLLKLNEEINQEYARANTIRVALLGNPNVGKSTVFNYLTGLHQHTGNWAGKTVAVAKGTYTFQSQQFEMIDLPGTYSLLAHSSEEEVTRDYVCFQPYDVCVIVCDATCFKRNLNLVLQSLEITNKAVIVLNLMDEAKKEQIEIDVEGLSEILGVPIVFMSAREQIGFDALKEAILKQSQSVNIETKPVVLYTKQLEQALQNLVETMVVDKDIKRFLALKLLDSHIDNEKLYAYIQNKEEVSVCLSKQIKVLQKEGVYEQFDEYVSMALGNTAEKIYEQYVTQADTDVSKKITIDRFVTGKFWGPVCMLVLLGIIFWITISAANVPSEILNQMFMHLQNWLHDVCKTYQVSAFLEGLFVDGIVKTCGWVIAVMLPPMAIFFPMFTLLEDFGYLPRIAFNLDAYFKKANTCGKQALTIMMGFGCNAVGVSGARIIDSPRERLIAIITNAFTPCNGRFPTMISILTMFFAGVLLAPWNDVLATLMLLGLIIFSVILTLFTSYVLSKTVLKGIPSSFTLELPPYRKPQFLKVCMRSIFDRTLFVLGRAICVAIPAGICIWLLANTYIDNLSLLTHIANFLDPFARLMGLDGVIVLAFILGFPANEIVVPIMIMAYMSSNSMMEFEQTSTLYQLLIDHGWTWVTALCMLVFTLVHFPCTTTLWTIRKETNSWKWTLVSFLLPTCIGIGLCMMIRGVTLVLF